MFDSKKESLIDKPTSSTMKSSNDFINYGMKESSVVLSGNGSVKYNTTGSDFVDQFSTISSYRTPRSFSAVSADMEKLWKQDPLLTLKFTFYLRMVTRTVSKFDGTKTANTQRGAGLKHEGILRYMWIAIYHSDVFWSNLTLFISCGSWKDIITMLSYDLQYHGWEGRKLPWNKFGKIILVGLENPNTSELVKKYLPTIRTKKKCVSLESQADTIIAKWLTSIIFGKKEGNDFSNYLKYAKLKSSGTAHVWQQLISQRKFLQIDFNTIHGKALALLVSSKFLKNNNLEKKYAEWISSQPVAKFTGYVYELIQGKKYTDLTNYQRKTIDSQFNKLVEVAKKGLESSNIRPISVLDCSGSMNSPMYLGGNKVGTLTSIEVAMSSAIFFNEMIDILSPFKDYYLSFSNITDMHKFLDTNSFTEKYFKSIREGYGGTDFSSVFKFLSSFKRLNPSVSEDLIPNFIVCFSDGEFNKVSGNLSNVSAGRKMLKNAGYSEEFCSSFGICLVDLPNTFYSSRPKPKFETFANEKNTFYFSGYDLSPLAFLFGVNGAKIPQNADEMFLATMDQEILNLLTV